ncbi:transglutaminase-like domain-containing protein [Lacimicrobium sp. SS2-24]|uniref:transglutaminase-like domain-containing protein n=1 Tax=Lacimicrobium sp. SS2-24 TaxID=2005569 RepID=UPI0011300CF9|nr:transglutaminase-like domain-containing protein [Lacimicrobium sp. SS2-24]
MYCTLFRGLWLALCGLTLLVCDAATGEQLSFDKAESDTQIQLRYRWRDHDELEQQLSFTFDKQQVNEQFQKLLSYQPHIAQRHVMVAMQKAAQQVDPREARISIRKIGEEIGFEVRSRKRKHLEHWQDKLSTLQQQAFDDYLQENYYAHFTDHFGKKGVKPDHIRYAKESVATLLPAANALYAKLKDNSQARAYVNMLLSWLQTIPYNPLESRLVSDGSGYLPPAEVLITNHGDCDSKTVVAAALLRSMLPTVKVAIIYLPNHALLGVQLAHGGKDHTLRLDGSTYLLAEPTGPALLPAGQIADQSLAAIQGGMYSFEIVNPN